ncbi:hypothetical protein E2320_017135 [Naja naja]|nr:hypothetical protein E2320_017135 [Naja naja]
MSSLRTTTLYRAVHDRRLEPVVTILHSSENRQIMPLAGPALSTHPSPPLPVSPYHTCMTSHASMTSLTAFSPARPAPPSPTQSLLTVFLFFLPTISCSDDQLCRDPSHGKPPGSKNEAQKAKKGSVRGCCQKRRSHAHSVR